MEISKGRTLAPTKPTPHSWAVGGGCWSGGRRTKKGERSETTEKKGLVLRGGHIVKKQEGGKEKLQRNRQGTGKQDEKGQSKKLAVKEGCDVPMGLSPVREGKRQKKSKGE